MSTNATPTWDKVVRTVCSPNCTGTCGVNAYVKGDRIVKLEPASYPDPRYQRICLKGISMATQRLYAPDRLKYPLRRKGERGGGAWERISWDDAFGEIQAHLERIASEYAPESNAFLTMTGNSGLKALLAPIRACNALQGTMFNNIGLMGDGACGMGLATVIGTMFCGQRYEDLKGSKLAIFLAKNIADTAHSEMHFLFDAMESGTKVISIDPRFSRTAAKADEWIAPRPGSDVALLIGMINVLLDEGLIDETYLRRHTNAPFLVREDTRALLRARDIFAGADESYVVWSASGAPARVTEAPDPHLRGRAELAFADGSRAFCRTAFDASEEAWRAMGLEGASAACDVSAETIRALAIEYATTNPATIILGQGAQRYHNGHLTFRGAFILGALAGKIGQPHGGVHWADGPLLQLLYCIPPTSDWVAPAGAMGKMLPGSRLNDIIAKGDPYPIKSLWITNYGFATQSAIFKDFVARSLPQLDLYLVTEQVMTPAARHADIVLPCVSYYEEEMDIVGGAEHWFVQLRQRAVSPVGESLSDWDIFKTLLTRMGHGDPWASDAEETCRRLIEDHPDPRFNSLDWRTLRETGVIGVDMPRVYTPFEDQRFPTPSGRLEIYAEQLTPFGQEVLKFEAPLEARRKDERDAYPLTLITAHQMHTVHSQHTNLPLIREHITEPRLDMHPRDASRRSLKQDDIVRVYNDRGQFKVKINITEAIRPGVLNLPQGWWPEHFIEGHYADVLHMPIDAAQDAMIDTNYAIYDATVEVERASNA